MKLQLKISTLKAAAICADKNYLHGYLNGVCVDIKNESQMVIIGTDESYMFIGVENYEGEWDGKAEQIIIPLKVIEVSLQWLTYKSGYITIERLDEKKLKLGAVIFEPIDGPYPDYAKVVPKVESVQARIGYYNYKYLNKAGKALKEASSDKRQTLHQNGEKDAAVMTCSLPNYICVIMPFNAWNKDKKLDSYKGIEIPK